MQVIIKKPVPAPLPPITYDIVGLTWDEMFMIRGALLYTPVSARRQDQRDNLHDRIAAGMADA